MGSVDADLVADARLGRMDALALLLERHRAVMHGVALATAGAAAQDIDDIVNEAFLVAVRGIERLRDPSAAGPWLAGIARNVTLQRRRASREVPTSDLVLARASQPVDVDDLLDQAATRDWVWAALGQLTEALRVPLILRHFSEVNTYAAIAEVLGIPIGTVRSRLYEGRRRLAAALLAEAERAHGDNAALTARRRRTFTDAYDRAGRGDGTLLLDSVVDDVEIRAHGLRDRGRDAMREFVASDMEAGVHLEVLDLISGADVSVLQGAFHNPWDNPHHCPPRTSQVLLHDGDDVRMLSLWFPPPESIELSVP